MSSPLAQKSSPLTLKRALSYSFTKSGSCSCRVTILEGFGDQSKGGDRRSKNQISNKISDARYIPQDSFGVVSSSFGLEHCPSVGLSFRPLSDLIIREQQNL